MPIQISPQFTAAKHPPGCGIDPKVDVFEDWMNGWVLRHAHALCAGNYVFQKDAGFAILTLVTVYFEPIESYHTGQSSNHQSKTFFRRGFFCVFDGLAATLKNNGFADANRVAAEIANEIYDQLRCGLFLCSVDGRDLRCCGRRKLTSIFTRTQQSPWAPKGSVMLAAASNPSLVTKPSQGLANLTLTWPERYPYHDFATLIKSRSRVKLAGCEVVTGLSVSGNAAPEKAPSRNMIILSTHQAMPHFRSVLVGDHCHVQVVALSAKFPGDVPINRACEP
jgi:hypothetical protein